MFVVQGFSPPPSHTQHNRPSDRVGKFKPRRQTNKDVDLSFLTDDSSAPNTPGPDKDSLQYKLGLAKPKFVAALYLIPPCAPCTPLS